MAMTDIEEAKDQAQERIEEAKGHAQGRISDLKDAAQEKKDEFVSKAKEATPDSAQAGVQQVASTAKRKPVPFAAAGIIAAALLIGWLVGRR
ncbi:MAG TPA: hypothetical protein VIC06_08915 [Solirubrobacteraceae bacterium]